jgi:hypothetical protein
VRHWGVLIAFDHFLEMFSISVRVHGELQSLQAMVLGKILGEGT